MQNYDRIKVLGAGAFGQAVLVRERGGERRHRVIKEVSVRPDKLAEAQAKAAFYASAATPASGLLPDELPVCVARTACDKYKQVTPMGPGAKVTGFLANLLGDDGMRALAARPLPAAGSRGWNCSTSATTISATRARRPSPRPASVPTRCRGWRSCFSTTTRLAMPACGPSPRPLPAGAGRADGAAYKACLHDNPGSDEPVDMALRKRQDS